MARYSERELNELKTKIDLVALVQSKGIKLEPHGRDKKGLCPFHPDKTPSMIITPEKNLFHCPACGTGGDVISFIQKYEGVSFTHAVELLKNGDASKLLRSSDHVKHSSKRKLKSPVDFDADDQEALKQVIAYYAMRLKENSQAIDYMKSRGIYSPEAIEKFKLGFADRTLGLHLPSKQVKAGREIREKLASIGIYRESGHEHFNGSLVFPIICEDGKITEIYGRKVTRGTKLRKGTPLHLYLPGPHIGIWNHEALRSPQVILCEAIIDALTFWANGFQNVTTSYGTAGFSKEMLKAFIDHRVQEVFIAYDNDDSGNESALRLAATLGAEGIKCFRVKLPFGSDVNSFAQSANNPTESLRSVLNSAEFMDSHLGASPEPHEILPDGQKDVSRPCGNTHSRQAEIKEESAGAGIAIPAEFEQSSVPEGQPNKQLAQSAKQSPTNSIPFERRGEDIIIKFSDREYRVRGLEKNTSYDILKVNIRASKDTAMHVDTLDLFNARHRKSFMHSVADELKAEPDMIKRDLGRVLLKLEELQEEQIKKELEPVEDEAQVALTEEETAEALELLRSPQLAERIISDVRKAGLVGEDVNALVAYLAASSRKTDDPLAVIIQSSSSAGKSSVMNAILALMPDEEQVIYTAMTGQSLFYMGETQLKHKILAIAEEEGAEQAGYALKILQSEKKLKIASTGKDAKTGRLVTQEYNVEGPCVIFMTTTSVEIDEELQNRCLVLTVNEDREQTRRIHELQRHSRTLEGMLVKEEKKNLLRVHQNAQRLLLPLMVVNPYAHQLTFLDNRLRARRDNIKYLNLISSIALIHQHQREIKTVEHKGETLSYIEVQISDIETANKLAGAILGTSLDDLAPQTRKLLELIYNHAKEQCEAHDIELQDLRVTRKEIRAVTAWGNTRLGVHLQRLVDLEYITTHPALGRKLVYEINYHGQGEDGSPFSMNLIDINKLQKQAYDVECTPLNPECTPLVQGMNALDTPLVHHPLLVANTSDQARNISDLANTAKKHLLAMPELTESDVVL
jgi:DNA primase catalytic core